jgi:hypothetical protein
METNAYRILFAVDSYTELKIYLVNVERSSLSLSNLIPSRFCEDSIFIKLKDDVKHTGSSYQNYQSVVESGSSINEFILFFKPFKTKFVNLDWPAVI